MSQKPIRQSQPLGVRAQTTPFSPPPPPRRVPSGVGVNKSGSIAPRIRATTLPSQSAKLGDSIPGFQTAFKSSGKGGGAFRPISENFSVNPANGTLSLTVPIHISPTRGSFGPDLNLSYDSGAGNGTFGFGWNVALPSISRKLNRGVPCYIDANDDLTLSGKDIVPVIQPGKALRQRGDFDVISYRPTLDSRTLRIEKLTKRSDSEEVYWKTVTAENVTSIYGDNDASRILDTTDGRKHIFSWLLSRTYDAHGNAIEYTYKQEDGKGIAGPDGLPTWEKNRSDESRTRQKYIKRIKYGNRGACRDLDQWEEIVWPDDWMFEVVFDYGEHEIDHPRCDGTMDWQLRKDVFSQCNTGFEIRNYRLCRRILMFHHFRDRQLLETLTASTVLTYDETPQRAALSSVAMQGHTFDRYNTQGLPQYTTESLPLWTFSYTTVPNPSDMEVLQAEVVNLIDIPGKSSATSTWLDLDGACDGVPGLLSWAESGGLLYQRHSGSSRRAEQTLFQDPIVLREQPNVDISNMGRFGDLDRNGKVDYICLDQDGVPQGFYEREDSDSWSNYSSFPHTPRGLPQNDSSTYIDLTGDGLDDLVLLTDEPQTLVWQKSLGKQGWSEIRRTYSDLPGRLPNLTSGSRTRSLVSDMTGDGLSDLVEVSLNSIMYWPNLGHGRFGAVVQMGNAPGLDMYGEPDLSRLTLIDVDGSGTADLLYILPSGGAILFYNLAGNCWSDGIRIPALWTSASSSTLFVLDILGKGTPSICWNETSTSAGAAQIKYIDIMGRNMKPHMLNAYHNGLGVATRIYYTPSTQFARQDEAIGNYWSTKLPFPVQCVSKVETRDSITGNLVTIEYAYHNGCYDPLEREFAGFEMVEHFYHESIVVGKAETYETPVLHTKSWFNVGLALDVDEKNFITSSQARSSLNTLNNADRTKSLKTLRGFAMRTETYGLDGSNKERFPYQVQEYSYDVEQIQPQATNAYPVTQLTPRAFITSNFERNMDDPHVTHEIVLKKNAYGDVEESLSVVYPRSAKHAASASYPEIEENHKAGSVTFIRTQHTNSIDDQSQIFRKPLPCRHQDYEILNLDFSGGILGVEDMRAYSFKDLPNAKQSSTWKALRSDNITLYRNSLLTGVLGIGLLQAYSTIYRSYSLVFTAGMVTTMNRGRDKCGVSGDFSEIFEKEGGYVSSGTLLAIHKQGGGEAQLGDDLAQQSNLWAPSPFSHFNTSPIANDELRIARSTFYLPTASQDAFGNVSTLTLDADCVLAESLTDAIGNKVVFENDYERLQPRKITDANKNAQEVLYDALGRITATALMGKGGSEDDTDSLDNFQQLVKPQDIVAVLNDPGGEVTKRLLGNCGSRTIHCFDKFDDQATILQRGFSNVQAPQQDRQPSFILEISRDFSFRSGKEGRPRVEITYFSGLGAELQQASLHDPDSSTDKWLLSGVSATTASGDEIRGSSPFYAAMPAFVAARQMPEDATTAFYEATGRLIGALSPDHLWSKTVFTSWATTEYGVGSNFMCDTPQSDPDIGVYFRRINSNQYLPTWHQSNRRGRAQEQAAATKSAVYNDTPLTTHFGSCGLPLRQVRQVGDKLYSQAYHYDFAGNRIRDFDSRSRLVEHNMYDKVGRSFLSRGMDNGDHWKISDVQGQVLLSWSSRGTCFYYKYDALRREVERRLSTGPDQWSTVVQTTYGDGVPEAEAANIKGRVWRVQDQAGVSTSARFDIRGQCVESTFKPAAEYKSTLDWAGEVLLEASTNVHKAKFDNFGQAIWEEDASGNQTRRTFSRSGHGQTVEFCELPSQKWVQFLVRTEFSADGLLVRAVYGNGVTTNFVYDEKSRHLILQTASRPANSGGLDTFEKISHTYDCEGRLIRSFDASEQSVYFRNCRIKPERDYTYDAIGQLVSATGRGQLPTTDGKATQLEPYGPDTGTVPNQGTVDSKQLYAYEETYRYDLVGNILTMRHAASEDSSVSGWTRTYVYQEPSLLSDDPKVFGNRLSKTIVGSKEENYKYVGPAGQVGCMTALSKYSRLDWNMDNMLSASSTQISRDGTPVITYYVYDYTGTRVRKITEGAAGPGEVPRKQRDTLYLNGMELQIRLKGDGIVTRSARRITKVSGEGLFALVESVDGSERPALTRYQIGKNLELDGSGRLISYEEYSPFGSVVYTAKYQDVEAPREYRFAGYEHDSETGLYCCGVRYYCPWLSRWLSPDPMGAVDGPNLYAHVSNDPINWADPQGTSRNESRQTPWLSTNLITVYKNEPFHGKILHSKVSKNRVIFRKTTLSFQRVNIRPARSPAPEQPESPQNQPEQPYLPSIHVQQASTARRRGATDNYMMNIKTSKDILTHRDMVKEALRKEKNPVELFWQENKGQIGRKTAGFFIGEGLGLVPFVGSVLKSGFNVLAGRFEKKLEQQKRRTENLENTELGYTHSQAIANRELGNQLAEIQSKTAEADLGSVFKSIVLKGAPAVLKDINTAQTAKERAAEPATITTNDVAAQDVSSEATTPNRFSQRPRRIQRSRKWVW